MKKLQHGIVAVMALALAACPSPDEAEEATTDLPPATTPGATTITPTPDVERVVLQPVGDMGAAGEATFREVGAQSSVQLTLRDAPPNSRLAAHIHQGTCEQGGPAVVPLETVITDGDGLGTSVTTVDMPITTLTDGQHFVQVHQPGEQPGAPVACGDIPARAG